MEKTYRFTLPQNKEVEKTNIRVENGEVFVDVELKDKFQPKDGDFCVLKDSIFIYNPKNGTISLNGYYAGINYKGEITINGDLNSGFGIRGEKMRPATASEKADFLERLEKECHKRWNAETKQLEDIRWRAKHGGKYYIVSGLCEIMSYEDYSSATDNGLYKLGNYFRTPEAAQKVAEQIKEIFRNSKAE